MGQRTYGSEFKLQTVLEALQSDGTDAEVALLNDFLGESRARLKKSAWQVSTENIPGSIGALRHRPAEEHLLLPEAS